MKDKGELWQCATAGEDWVYRSGEAVIMLVRFVKDDSNERMGRLPSLPSRCSWSEAVCSSLATSTNRCNG